jgi:hypothetical protein
MKLPYLYIVCAVTVCGLYGLCWTDVMKFGMFIEVSVHACNVLSEY